MVDSSQVGDLGARKVSQAPSETNVPDKVLVKLPVELVWFPLGQTWVRSLPTGQREGNVDLAKTQVTPNLLQYVPE